MKKAKAPRVPVLESAFEVNLPKILRAIRESGRPEVVLVDGAERTIAMASETRLAVHLGGRVWTADIVTVPCLNDRVRPLLKCPRAHEGNFQALYWRAGELACRHCHGLRYRSALAAGPAERAHLARIKMMKLDHPHGQLLRSRKPGKWRSKHRRSLGKLVKAHSLYYSEIIPRLKAGVK